MTLSKPIPKTLLPHTATLKTPKPSGIWGAGEYDEITLYNVRFEQSEKARQSKTGESRSKGAKLYFDCTNSVAESDSGEIDVEFNLSQLAVVFGKTYKVGGFKAVMAGDRVHHYVVELI